MVYLDSDVLINFFVEQNSAKHKEADSLFQEAAGSDALFMSFLVLQEVAFVLGKLNVPESEIQLKIKSMLAFTPYAYQKSEYERALELAGQIGFQHFNDCLHVAIAELHCTEIITYNKSDFSRLRPLTSLKVSIL